MKKALFVSLLTVLSYQALAVKAESKQENRIEEIEMYRKQRQAYWEDRKQEIKNSKNLFAKKRREELLAEIDQRQKEENKKISEALYKGAREQYEFFPDF